MMKNQKMWKGFVIGLCISALTGCGAGSNKKTGGEDMHVTEDQSIIFDEEDMHSGFRLTNEPTAPVFYLFLYF